MLYIAAFILVIPIVSLLGHLFKSEGRISLLENPLKITYYIIAFGYFYIFWFERGILFDYVQINFAMQMLIYGILALAPIFQSDLPN